MDVFLSHPDLSCSSFLSLPIGPDSSIYDGPSPFTICIQALYLVAVVRPVDPEVEDRLAQETEVRKKEEDLGDKVHPLSGYGLLQAKEEARKLRMIRVLMRPVLSAHIPTQAVLIEFTHYHKQTGILALVSILLDQTQKGRVLSFISIQLFHISPLFGPDLHVTWMVLALLQE
ncbi:hypothetical protein cypCar_00005772 [Cyprinus carpio]|nr:hypothetical protein cypCar_00005772 [Cyprinus carpio]